MKTSRIAGGLALCVSLLGIASPTDAQTLIERPLAPVNANDPRPRFAADEILVRYQGEVAPESAQVRAVESAFALKRMRVNRFIGVYRYQLPPSLNVAEAIRRLSADPRVEYAEPNYLYYLDAVPNDSFYDNYNAVATDLQKWYFAGIGADTNLNAEAAWDITTGRTDVLLAVIDSGVDLDHPDLAANIWTNPGEIAGNGVDDDGNGFVDDVNGWDFASNDNNPNPDLGNGIDDDFSGGPDSNTFHGTFSASCAAARGNNGVGVTGAAWTCRIMAVKIFTDDGGAFLSDIADGITYAASNGADVSNMSFGGGGATSMLNAVNFAWGQGVVQVASAGNGNSSSAQFPSSYAHVVSVGATDSGSVLTGGSGDLDGRASFSQYGTAAVDVVAPGTDLVGAAVNSVADGSPGTANYFISSGTSFSGPTVAGLAVLLLSRARDLGVTLTNDDVEAIIQNTAVDLPDDPGDSPNGGASWDNHGRVSFLDAVNAVTGGGPTNNPPVANAGVDQSGVVGTTFTFNGTGSFDPDGDPLVSYVWNFGDGSANATGSIVTHSFATANTYTVTLTVSDGTLTDNDTASVTVNPAGGGAIVYFVSVGTNTIGGAGSVANEDIVQYNASSGSFSLYFDGSDVGLASAAVDGMTILGDGSILLSFTAAFSVAGLIGGPGGSTSVADTDIVRFTPTSLGANTNGVFEFYFDGSDVGLTTSGEDVDSIGIDASGRLVLSVTSTGSVTGLTGIQDEDLFVFTATSLGQATAGSFSMLFDGSDVGLSTTADEDITAAHLGASGAVYLSTLGAFSVTGASGGDEDVIRFTPTSLGDTTAGTFTLYLDGSAVGMPAGVDINGLFIVE